MELTIDAFLEAKRLGLPHVGKACSNSTIVTYGKALRRAERLVGKPLAKFTEKDGERFLREADKEGVPAESKNLVISALRAFFDWAIGNGMYADKNPFAQVRKQPTSRRLPSVLTIEEVDRLFSAIEANEQDKREELLTRDDNTRNFGWAKEGSVTKYVLIFKIMYYAGLRIGEATSLRKDDVLIDGIRVLGKGSKERFVPLRQVILGELRLFIAEHPYTRFVFYGEAGRAFGVDLGKPMGANKLYAVFTAGLRRAGLPEDLTRSSPESSVKVLQA